MSFVSSITTWVSGISITMDMLIILCLTEFLMLAIIGLIYLFRKNKNLKKVITKLQILIKSKKSETSQKEHVSAYIQEQLCLSELQHETLLNSKHPEEDTDKHIKALSERLLVLNSELLTLPEYIGNDENYWSSIYTRYADLTPSYDKSNEQTNTDVNSVETLEEIESIDEEMLLSLSDMEGDYDSSNSPESIEDTGKESPVLDSDKKNTQELNIKDTASEEIGRLRDIISRQYSSIDGLKMSIKDIQALGMDSDNKTLNKKFTTLMNQSGTLLEEQEQLNMCIDVLEKENLRLSEEILHHKSESASKEQTNNSTNAKIDDAQAKSIMEGLIQTNKEQLQCISILEDEITSLKNNQPEPSKGVESIDTTSNKMIDEYVGTIDELKYKLTDKNSEINLLREEYDTLKQKYMVISQKVANE